MVEDKEEKMGVGSGVVEHLLRHRPDPPIGQLIALVGEEVAVELEQRGERVRGEFCEYLKTRLTSAFKAKNRKFTSQSTHREP